MKLYLTGLAILAGSTLAIGNAQGLKTPTNSGLIAERAISVTSPSGGGLISPGLGKDDCTDLPMDNIGTGIGTYAFDTIGATIGITNPGQLEVNCSEFGLTSVQDDVWVNWTSDFDGQAVLTTVGFTTFDTKIGVYPDQGGCPANGTSLDCNDDSGGTFQSTITWAVTNGTTYTLQIGEYPSGTSSGGGTGSYDISQFVAPPCGIGDSGVSDNGLAPGDPTHDFIWMKRYPCLGGVDEVGVAFSWHLTGSPVDVGTPYEMYVWDDTDSDGDPATGMVLVHTVTGLTVASAGTDTLETTVFASTIFVTGEAWVGVKLLAADWASHWPAATDSSYLPYFAADNAYAMGAGVDANDLITTSAVLGVQAWNWMVRADGPGASSNVGVPFCFGDGSDGASCPCGNVPLVGSGEGCVNVSGLGAYIVGSGIPSVSGDSLVLAVNQAAPSDFGIFAQNIAMGTPFTFYNGAFCLPTDGHLVRHYNPPAVAPTVTDPTGYGVNAQGMTLGDFLGDTQPGVTVYYQFWGRDNGGPCAFGANFSAGVAVTWLP